MSGWHLVEGTYVCVAGQRVRLLRVPRTHKALQRWSGFNRARAYVFVHPICSGELEDRAPLLHTRGSFWHRTPLLSDAALDTDYRLLEALAGYDRFCGSGVCGVILTRGDALQEQLNSGLGIPLSQILPGLPKEKEREYDSVLSSIFSQFTKDPNPSRNRWQVNAVRRD